jgi:Ca2+:H+ antiporter
MSGRRSNDDIEANESDPLIGNQTNTSSVPSRSHFNDIRTILFSSYINMLLIVLPFALVSGALEWSPTIVFATNFFALIPLASVLSFATVGLTTSKAVGQVIGGFLSITLGNATELIVGIVSLRNEQVKLIQTTMLGSILSTLLFVISRLYLRLFMK